MSEERTAAYTVAPGLTPDAVAIVPPTDGMPIWLSVDVEKWFGELTALEAEVLAWRGICLSPTQRLRATQLAEGASIAAVRPDLVLQERALEYFREEFERLKGEQA